MAEKLLKAIIPPPPAHMVGDGFNVHNFFPAHPQIGQHGMSPFYLMDYNARMLLPPSEHIPGVGVHPHRGFETVTIAYHGSIEHGDSYGNKGVIGQGEVQWMTAASGVLHKEYHEENFSKQGGWFQMVQLWVNLPAKDKMGNPRYQAITRKQMGRYELPDSKGVVSVIAGNYQGVAGAASTFTPIEMYDIELYTGADLLIESPADYNTGFLLVEGTVQLNMRHKVPQDHFAYFANEGESIRIQAEEPARILFLSGQPIHEPIAQYGPFLMNTHQEIQQAIADLQQGKFGYLED